MTTETVTQPPPGRCLRCGAEVTIAPTGRQREYCGPRCRQAAKRRRDKLGPDWWLQQAWATGWREQAATSGEHPDHSPARQPQPRTERHNSWLTIYGVLYCPGCRHGYHRASHATCPRCGNATPKD